MTRIHTLLGTCVTLLVTSAIPALGQPVITSPNANQTFVAGPDFASDVLQDPWDFSNVDDLSQHPDDYMGWAQSASARLIGPSAYGMTGKFVATSGSTDPNVGLLYQGGARVLNPGRSGLRFPIETARYRRLAFQLKATNVGGGTGASAHWFFGPKDHLSPAAIGTAASATPITDGERVYLIDLAASVAGTPYTAYGLVAGLRLDPLDPPSTVGSAIELDWVRLTAADNAPSAAMMDVAATNCNGSVSLEVLHGGIATVVDTSMPLRFNYGIFPPGNYQLRLTCNGGPSSPVPFTINDPPRITVLQPDERGGADYATTVLGNPWDFADAADVPSSFSVEFLPGGPPGHAYARNTAPSPGDSQLFLLHREGAQRPIATSRFRYLTFSLGLNAPFSLGADGSVARLYWASTPSGFDGSVATPTTPMMVWPGNRSYTVDLASLSQAGGTLEQCVACFPWAARSARYFRIDPHEFTSAQVPFLLGAVTLAAPDEVVQGQSFPIQWSVSGVSAGTVNLYYDNDTNPASGRQLIASGLATTSYNWPVGSLAPGNYYIYVEVNEPTPGGTDTRGAYSTGVLRVISAANSPVVTMTSHSTGGSAHAPFNINGCAYNAATGAAADEVIVYAHPLQGQMGGVTQVLGHNAAGGMGTQSAPACASGPGYRVDDIISLQPGLWTFRVLARNPVTGDFDEVQAQNVTMAHTAAPARNLRASISGNTVALAWDPPAQGSITQYRIEAAGNPSFAGFMWAVLPPNQTSVSATVGNGLYYVRVVTGNVFTSEGPASNVITFTLPGGSAVAPPGAVTLSGQLTTNPVSLNWSQAGGGAAAYALHAGTGPGQSNIAIVPMGGATSLPPTVVPLGVTIFARIVASNAAGSTTSNEVVVNVPVPGPPGGPPIQLDPIVSGHNVTLRWNAPPNSPTPTSYAIVGRLPGSPAVIALLPGVTSTSVPIPGVPSGSYVVSIVAIYGPTPSIESNFKTLVVP